jgi:hypothetical protein
MIDIKKTEKQISHPLEEALNIEPNSTTIEQVEVVADLVPDQEYDEKEKEIENDYQTVINAALETYVKLQDEMEGTDKRYIARIGEVSALMLNTALSGINGKAKIKELKNKLKAKSLEGPRTVNNILQIDRNELVRKLKGETKKDE